MTKLFFCICLLQLGHLLKSMYITVFLIMSVSVTFHTEDTNHFCSNYCSFCLIKNAVNVLKILTPFLFLQDAYIYSCSPRTDVVKVVPEVLYIAMIDSLR